jgi:hypothetical protein
VKHRTYHGFSKKLMLELIRFPRVDFSFPDFGVLMQEIKITNNHQNFAVAKLDLPLL